MKEIINTLWQGKWIVAVITIIALLISSLYSFVIADPVYKGKSEVTIHKVATVPESIQPYIDEMTKPELFQQTMTSPDVLSDVIEENNLDTTVSSLQSGLQIELPSDSENTSSIITISMEGTDREKIASIIDSAVSTTKAAIGDKIQTRLTSLEEEYQQKMTEEDEKITTAVQEFNEMGADDGIPALIQFQQNTNSDGQYVFEMSEALLNDIQSLDKQTKIEYEKINENIANLTELYNFYNSKHDDISSVSTMNIMDLSMDVVSDTFVPEAPIAPSKLLNLAISVVLGLMIGVGVVFLREYMKDEEANKSH
ncbi:Wzz/FepE/Etk N-terminal domain-containing protein [Lentibacillus cibarius]|uniref:Wzz/FepE/Etk N-terminal domain-containing protein n=1 Tax=Lentibacillus cibarius TaxID=2583219 RepID=UPI0014872F63|nr:Wzz/FepE/Etk N-terminal domain-containing protein [Lentibacillus cibarius]